MAKSRNNKGKDQKTGSKRKDFKQSPRKYGETAETSERNTGAYGQTYGGNDVSWYSRNPALIEAAAKIPFPYVPGRSIPLDAIAGVPSIDNANDINQYTLDYRYPGICTLTFAPSVGYAEDVADPINVAAREVYGKIRAKYSGSLEADAPDIMMYLLAVDSLYMEYENMKRAYYLINQYTPYNNYFPEAVIKALGFDFDNLRIHKTYFFQRIVEAGSILSKFKVPDRMDLFKRHQFMCANLYADRASDKAQIYAFKLGASYKLENTDTMTKLRCSKWNTNQFLTVAEVWQKFKSHMDALMNWDTGYTILGYLERAYEGETFMVPSPVIQEGRLVPVYNEEILDQIQNATTAPIGIESLSITQDPTHNNVLISKPYFYNADNYSILGFQEGINNTPLITLPSNAQPSVPEIVIATRLIPVIREIDEESGKVYVDCGSEILTEISFYESADGIPSNEQLTANSGWIDLAHSESVEDTLRKFMGAMAKLSGYRRHPIYFYTLMSNKSPNERVPRNYVFCDVDNVTSTDANTVRNLHRICLYSEFNCFN